MRAAAFIALLATALFVIRVTAPSDLMDNDQERPASYVLDAAVNGHWLVQRDWTGAIASKPPLYTWLAAAATLAIGHASLVALYLPAGLATAGVALLILYAGRRYFSAAAGMFAAVAYLASYVAVKQMALVRTDGVFSFWVTAGALLAFRAWQTGRGWTWFWLVGAAATLTKGPLGVVFAAAGLLAAWWERRSLPVVAAPVAAGMPLPRHRGWAGQWWGVALFLVLTAGWFVLAYREAGQPLVDRLLGRELFGHVVHGAKGARPLEHFYLAPLYFIGRFLPWSLVAAVALWQVWRRPADAEERRFERFLVCWLLVGIGLLSLAAHQRGDLVFPLVPAAALLAGRELSRWMGRWALAVMAAAVLVFSVVQFHVMGPRQVPVQRTAGMRELAAQIETRPVLHVDGPYALQFFLGTMRRTASYEEAARSTNGAIVVRDRTRLPAASELGRWPATGDAYVWVLTNRE